MFAVSVRTTMEALLLCHEIQILACICWLMKMQAATIFVLLVI